MIVGAGAVGVEMAGENLIEIRYIREILPLFKI